MSSILPLIISSQIIWSISGLDSLTCKTEGPQAQVIGRATAFFTCKKGLMEGPYKLVDKKSDLTLEQGQFRRGQLHGKITKLSSSGPDEELEFSNGRLSGLVSIYKMVINKFISDKIKVRDGLREGLSRKFNRSNQLIMEQLYKTGVREGLTKIYHLDRKNDSSILASTSEWKRGRLDGITKQFDKKTGKLKSSKIYRAGKLVNQTKSDTIIDIPINDEVSALSWQNLKTRGADMTTNLAKSFRCDGDGKKQNLINSNTDVAIFTCKNGQIEGPAAVVGTIYHLDMFGKVKLMTHFKNGKLSGSSYSYDYIGMQQEVNYANGVRHGISKFYFDGVLIFELEFINGKQGQRIRFFDQNQANAFKTWHDRMLTHQQHLKAVNNAICDQPDKPWDEKLCLDRIQKSPIKRAEIISEVGCKQKHSMACMYFGLFTTDQNLRRSRWEEGCRYSASECYKFMGLFMYSMRYDFMMEIAGFACNNGLEMACAERKQIEPEFIKQRELTKMSLARIPKFEPFIKSVRDANVKRAIDYKLGTEVSFGQMEKIILNEKPVNKRIRVPIKRCGTVSLVENDEFGYTIECSAGHPRVWYRVVVDSKLAATLPQKFGVGLEEPVYLTGTVIKLQGTGVLDVMVIVPDSSEI